MRLASKPSSLLVNGMPSRTSSKYTSLAPVRAMASTMFSSLPNWMKRRELYTVFSCAVRHPLAMLFAPVEKLSMAGTRP